MAAYAAPSTLGLTGRPHFLLRRLHSLTGIVPIGMFLMFHLFTNMQMIFPGKFQHEVEFIHGLPALIFLEIFGLWLPIGFHAALGVVYTFTGAKTNTANYPYWGNVRYTLQRITGIIALVFIFFHVATLRWQWDVIWFTPFFLEGPLNDGTMHPLSHASTSVALTASWIVLTLYIVGVYSAVYHWCNGLWTAAITWGVTISDKAQKQFAYVCGLLFVGLSIFAALGIGAAVGYEMTPQDVEAYNNALAETRADVELIPFPEEEAYRPGEG